MDATHNITGLGAVRRDFTRAVMLSCVDAIPGLLSPIVVEAKAILFGLSTAFAGGFSAVVVESDCASVIKMLSDGSQPLSEVGVVISDIQDALSSNSFSVQFLHVYRSGNGVAHSLAKLATAEKKFLVWVKEVPQSVESAIELDATFKL
ncbi:hypothetical protein ACOSQ3_031799 [Xanthoceras sorbifolium]